MNKEDLNNDFEPTEEFNSENMSEECLEDTQNDTKNADLTEENNQESSLEDKYNELNNSYMRLLADFDNFRKRMIKENNAAKKDAAEKIVVDMLPVVDDFERALDSIKTAEDIDAVKEGVDLIYNKFLSFLTRQGVAEVASIGEVFSSDRHEAITTIPAQNEDDKDKIIDCIEKGYTLGDKVIRFPKVIVAK